MWMRFKKTGTWLVITLASFLTLVALQATQQQAEAAPCATGFAFPSVSALPLTDPQWGLTNLFSFNNPIIDGNKLQKYVTPVPNALTPGFIYSTNGTQGGEPLYTVSMREITQGLGVIDATTSCTGPPNTLWAYGDARDNGAAAYTGTAPHSVPGPTFDVMSNVPHRTIWTNELPNTNPLHHPANVDPTLDCGPKAPGCAPFNRVVPHTHGAHVADDSDGGPDQWFTPGFAITGHNWQPNTHIPSATIGTYRFENTQEAGTVWYHDHAMGLTHLNVFAGLAGFNIIRDANEIAMQTPPAGGGLAKLPKYPFENLLAIQDRVFDTTGKLYSPDRPVQDLNATLTGVACDPALPKTVSAANPVISPYACVAANLVGGVGTTLLPTTPCDPQASIVAPVSRFACPVKYFTRNPDNSLNIIPTGTVPPAGALTFPSITTEYWGNIILVNGQVWPKQDVEKRVYRFRWLNGSDSRTYILRLVDKTTKLPIAGLDIWQIGTEQGFLPKPVKVTVNDPTATGVNPTTGAAITVACPAGAPQSTVSPTAGQCYTQTNGIVLMPGERVDVLVDFTNVALNTQVILQNLGPDVPYTGEYPPAGGPLGNGQTPTAIVPEVMLFNVVAASAAPNTTAPNLITSLRAAPVAALTPTATRTLYLAERVDQFGRLALTVNGVDYMSAVDQFVPLGTTEEWDIVNLTPDGHPMHPHLVAHEVINRQDLMVGTVPFAAPMNLPMMGTTVQAQFNGVAPNPAMPTATGPIYLPEPNEVGAWKDTLFVPPGKVTRIKAKFDIPGLYVFHCHILSHEENDMMRPFAVTTPAKSVVLTASSVSQPSATAVPVKFTAAAKTGITTMSAAQAGLPVASQIPYADSNAYEYNFSVTGPAGVAVTKPDNMVYNTVTMMGIQSLNSAQGYSMYREATWTPPKTPGTYVVTVKAVPMGANPAIAANVVSGTLNYTVNAPAVSGVTSTTANGAYKAGAVVNITVTFNQSVTSTAGLTLTTNSGATLTSGPITAPVSSIGITYTVAATDNTPAGQFLNITGITGSITDAALNAVTNPVIPAGFNLAGSKQIQIDNTPPAVTITAPTATVVNTPTVTVSCTASDPVGIKSLTVNGTAVTPAVAGFYSTAVALTPNTANIITVVATDMAGNVTTVTRTVTNDNVLPVTTASPAAGNYSGTVTISLTSSKAGAVIRYTTDGTVPTGTSPIYTAPFVLTSLTTKTFNVQFFAVDAAGNTEAVKSASYTIHVSDLTNATVTINNKALFTSTPNVTLALTATDPLGITKMQVACDGLTFGASEAFAATRACTLTAGDGIKTVAVKYIDAIGTVYNPVSASITLKTALPVTTATPAAGTYNGAISAVLSSDPGAKIYYTTNGVAPIVDPALLYTVPVTIPATATLKFFAVDQAGNQEVVQSRVFTIAGSDLTGSVKINNASPFTNNASVTLALSAADPFGVGQYMVSNDGVTYQTVAINPAAPTFSASIPWLLTTGDGLKTVYVKYVDTPTPNNVYGPFTAQVTLDTVPPVTTATPATGAYNGAISAVLSTEPGAKTYYTTNGAMPTIDPARLYTGPITISATTTLKYFSVDQAGNQEALQSRVFTIAASDLTGSVKINNAALFTNNASVTLALSAADPLGVGQYMVSNDGVTYQTVVISPAAPTFSASIPWLLTPGDGLKTVYVKYVDTPTPNNVYGPFTAQITLDTVPPVTTAKPLSGTYNGTISAVLSTEPGAKTYYTTNGVAPTIDPALLYTAPVTITATTTLKYFSVDQAGNQEAVQSRVFTIAGVDLTGSVKINNASPFTNSANATLALSAADPLGVKQYMVSNDDITYQTVAVNPAVPTFSASIPWLLTPGDGLKTVYVKYVDTPTPNNVYGPFTAQVTLDTLAPTLAFTAPPADAFVNTSGIQVSGTVSDAGGVKSVTVNGAAAAIGAGGTFTANVQLAAGANTITAIASDLAGNTTTITRNVTLDVTAPQTAATPPAGTYSGSVTITLAANKPATIYYSTDGIDPKIAPANVYTVPFTLSSPTTASITVKYFAVDKAGNVEALKSGVYALHTADLVSAVAINNGKAYTNSANVTLAISAADLAGVASYAISTDNGVTYKAPVAITPPVANFSATVPLTLPAGDGLKTVYVKCTDALGVVYPPALAQITLDTLPPVTSVTPASGTYTGGVTVALSANEPATIYYTTDGSAPSISSPIYTAPFTLNAPGTSVLVNFFAVDLAGNAEAPKSATYNFTHSADMTATLSINGGDRYTKSRNVVLSFSAADPVGGGVATVSFSNDGITFTTPVPYAPTTSMPWTLGPGDDLKTVYFRFTDKGASGVAPNTYNFTASIYLADGVEAGSGDLDGDGKVDIKDVLFSLQASTGLKKLTIAEQARADVGEVVNGKATPKGKIDVGDALMILKKTIGLVAF